MLPIISSATFNQSIVQIRQPRLLGKNSCNDWPLVTESSMNCRFSSSSRESRIGMFVLAK